MIEGKYTCHIVMDFDKYPCDHEYMQCNIDMMTMLTEDGA